MRRARVAIVVVSSLIAVSVALAAPHKKRKAPPAPTAAPAPASAPAAAPPVAPTPAPTPAAPAPAPTTRPAPAIDLTPRVPPPGHPAVGSGTHCAHCHTVQGWNDVRFDHTKTGFPLNGGHRHVTCNGCHPVNFRVQVPERCAGCHRDAHSGEFGARCEGCHDERSWRTNFTADAHRNTNFPLSGAHAFIPCTECHPQVRDRVFARARVTCVSCHQADFDRAALTSIDHVAAGFPTDCRRCHSSFRFSPARYPDHDLCFRLSSGPHAGIRCLDCHTSAPSTLALGTCSTGNWSCTNCHAHSQPRTDPQHANVAGYNYTSRKCYECHRTGLQ